MHQQCSHPGTGTNANPYSRGLRRLQRMQSAANGPEPTFPTPDPGVARVWTRACCCGKAKVGIAAHRGAADMIGSDVTIFEVELEQEKIDKIADVAARGAAIAADLGQELEAVSDFLSHYFRHVDPLDIDERSVEDLLGLVESHYRLAMQRPPARATIAIRTPSQSEDGWSAGGATVIQIVTDDRPFLVDSVTMEVLRQGWSIREVFHPQFLIRRDVGGTLREIVRTTQLGPDPEILQESWMHLEILP